MSERTFFTDALATNPGNTGLASALGALDNYTNRAAANAAAAATAAWPMTLGGDEGGGMFSGLGDMFANNDLMSGITGFGSLLMDGLALPSALKNAKLTNEINQANLTAFNQDRATHNTTKTNMDNVAKNYNQQMVA